MKDPRKAFAGKRAARKPVRTDPRYELVFERSLSRQGALTQPPRPTVRPSPAPRQGGADRAVAGVKRDDRRVEVGSVPIVLARLRSLAERGGSALGEAYARAARVVLTGTERLEDLRAERRLRQRANAKPTGRGAGATARPKQLISPKVSV